MRTIILACLMSVQILFSYGQKEVSIYELGDSIVDCEINFKNLFDNWTTPNVTNADSYKLLKYDLVEIITDSVKYNHYRNYFSGVEAVGASVQASMGGSSDGKRFRELYIKPGFAHREFYDQRELPEETREMFTDEFKAEAIDILTREINIDTMDLKHYHYEKITLDTIRIQGVVTSTSKGGINLKAASPNSISQNYIDIVMKSERGFDNLKFDNLKTDKKRLLILEQLLIEKINRQLYFNEKVNIGDKVYRIDFEYDGKLYNNYVICSAESKKVIMDHFFLSIRLEIEGD